MSLCPICSTPANAQKYQHRYWYCSGCNFYFLDRDRIAAEVPNNDEYDEAYYSRGTSKFLRLFTSLQWRIDLASIIHYLKTRPNIIDVGCGSGGLVLYLRKQKLNASGFDTSPHAIALAERAGIPMKNLYWGKDGKMNLPGNTFDLATSFHVLEHVAAPSDHVRDIGLSLKVGGMLIMRVPNIDSLEARAGKSDWLHYDYPYHVAQYTPKALRRILERNGFENVQIRPNATQYRQVLLYSLLSAIGLKPLMQRTKICLLPLQLFFIPLSVLLAVVFRDSGIIEAIATKNASAPYDSEKRR